MSKPIARAMLFGLTAALCLAGAARAEDPEQSFATLIGRGFKIVGTSYVPPFDNVKNSAMVITLQLDKAVAVCTFAAATWENMTDKTLKDDAKACDVRFY
jgi:hypothetical protein